MCYNNEIGVAAPGDADEQTHQRQQRTAANAECHQRKGHHHPAGRQQNGLPAADVGGQITGDEDGCQAAPGGQAQQHACLGVADAVLFPEEGHQIAHQQRAGTADGEHKQGGGQKPVLLLGS